MALSPAHKTVHPVSHAWRGSVVAGRKLHADQFALGEEKERDAEQGLLFEQEKKKHTPLLHASLSQHNNCYYCASNFYTQALKMLMLSVYRKP